MDSGRPLRRPYLQQPRLRSPPQRWSRWMGFRRRSDHASDDRRTAGPVSPKDQWLNTDESDCQPADDPAAKATFV